MNRLIFTLAVLGLMLVPIGSIFLAEGVDVLHPIAGGWIIDSRRFVEVLGEENVVAWLNGHIHSEHSMQGSQVEKWGTKFIDDGSINENPESLLLSFENGERIVEVKSRDHSKSQWNELDKFSFYLEYPFRCKGRNENIKVWVWSDSQPVTGDEWKRLEKAIEDSDENMRPDISLVLGDLVDHGAVEEFKKAKEYLDNSDLSLENFYELAGNHEFGPYFTGDHSNYRRHIENDLRYKLRIGNVLFVFISDERPGSPGDISDETFEWWKNVVKSNQENYNIITLAHHPLGETTRGTHERSSVMGLWFAEVPFLVYLVITVILISPIIAFEVS